MRRVMTSSRGASAVEFALIMPLFVLILFGIIEFSLLMYNKAMITNASREGARRGIVYRVDTSTDPAQYDPLSDAEIKTEIMNYLGDHLISLSGTSAPVITITPEDTTPRVSGAILTVRVDYNYTFLVVASIASIASRGGGELPGSINLSSTTAMRME